MNAQIPTVISVEDDDDLYEVIRLSLLPLPIRLIHASSGGEALDLLRRHAADLIILDIMLPDINGWNVLKQLLSQELSVKGVIILTAQTGATHRVIAHLQEVAAYMTKPFKPLELRSKVVEILQLERV